MAVLNRNQIKLTISTPHFIWWQLNNKNCEVNPENGSGVASILHLIIWKPVLLVCVSAFLSLSVVFVSVLTWQTCPEGNLYRWSECQTCFPTSRKCNSYSLQCATSSSSWWYSFVKTGQSIPLMRTCLHDQQVSQCYKCFAPYPVTLDLCAYSVVILLFYD